MKRKMVWLFLILGFLFAAAHNFAMATSLYWFYPWFDIPMHFWGGALVSLGLFSLYSFKPTPISPSLAITVLALLLVAISWEVFERVIDSYNPVTYIFDTSKDLLVGLFGGLSAHFLLRRFRM